MPDLNDFDFKSIHDYLGELSQFITEKTEGNLRIVTIVTDDTDEDLTKTAIVACGDKRRVVRTLKTAYMNSIKDKDEILDQLISPETKRMIKKILSGE